MIFDDKPDPTSPFPYVTKGVHIRTCGLYVQSLASLAGAQPKVAARSIRIDGVVAHLRGDHPITPKEVAVWLVPDDPSLDLSDVEGVWIERCEKCDRIEVGPIPLNFLLPKDSG